MPWSLIASVAPLLCFVGVIFLFQHKSEKKYDKKCVESRKAIEPIAKIADQRHRKKFGRPSTELSKVFPELEATK